MDYTAKKKELEQKSKELSRQRDTLMSQADEIGKELLRIQGEYRLIGELLDKTPIAEAETEKEKENKK